MLTKKDYCDYETCVALWSMGLIPHPYHNTDTEKVMAIISLYEAQKWLREEKRLHITIYSMSQDSWQYRVTKPHQLLEDGLFGEDFDSYEYALSEAIKSTVKLLKEK